MFIPPHWNAYILILPKVSKSSVISAVVATATRESTRTSVSTKAERISYTYRGNKNARAKRTTF